MNKEDFDQLISGIEFNLSTVKYDFEIAEAFNNLLEKHAATLTSEQEQQLKWEFLLFRLITNNSFKNDGLRTMRFEPLVVYKNGAIFPDPNSFTAEAFSYFRTRLKKCVNSILKARYADFLWEKSKLKKKHLYAIEAAEQYLFSVDLYDNEGNTIERLDGLQRATELSLIIEGKKSKKPLTKNVVTKLNEQIDKIIQGGNYRWILEMFELVIVLNTFYSKDQIGKFINICDKAALSYKNNQNFHLQRSFLKVKAGLVKLFDPSVGAKKDVDEEIGQSYIDEAEAKSGSGLVKVHFLQEAITHFSKLGNKKKVDELIAEVKTATTQAIENKEFKEFSTTVKLENKDFVRMKTSLGIGKEVPERIGVVPTFFPHWDHAIKMTEEHSKKFIFTHFAKKVTYGKEYPISAPQTAEQELEDNIMTNFSIEAKLALHWLTGFLEELKKEKKVAVEDFKQFFTKLQIIDKDTYETVCSGLEAYFEGNHFSAVCILAPQLEDLLRQLLTILGGQTTIRHIQAGAFTEKNLGRILIELKPLISEPMFRYISWVMDDYRGYNLRYYVAHGFFKKKNGSPIYSTALIHIFCLIIIRINFSTKEQK